MAEKLIEQIVFKLVRKLSVNKAILQRTFKERSFRFDERAVILFLKLNLRRDFFFSERYAFRRGIIKT